MTAMGKAELPGKSGSGIKAMLDQSPSCGAATPASPAGVVNAVAFLAGPERQYMTGSDIRADGSGVPILRWLLMQDSVEKPGSRRMVVVVRLR